MMRSKLLLLSLWILLPLVKAPVVCASTVFFEDFEGNAAGWVMDGNVEISGGKAAIHDTGGYSLLYQTIVLEPGYFSLEFDYQISTLGASLEICPEGEGCYYSFPDLLWANLYFSLDEWEGDELFQICGPIDPDSGMQHFYGVFQNPGIQATPMFEVIGYNSADGDSLVYLDNIEINALDSTPIPEPGTLGFMVFGLMGIAFVGSKRLSN